MSKAGTGGAGEAPATAVSRQTIGRLAEDRAAAELQRHGLRLLARNWRVARGPGRSGGEIDLVMRDGDGTLVFVEVRCRASARFGGAAASIGSAKQRALRFAAQCYLAALAAPPPCRFDVVTVEPDGVGWLRGVDLAA